MTWFEELMGFPERSGEDVRSQIEVDGVQLKSLVNHRSFIAGEFETPTLNQLRKNATSPVDDPGNLQLQELVADVRELHLEPNNRGAVFQVASQFNCLEMASPSLTPEDGVGVYEHDWTQGPACSICCGAGTIYRNYFVNVNGQVGQSAKNQVDCLAEIGKRLSNGNASLWQMQNGYCFPTPEGLAEIERRLSSCDSPSLDQLRGLLRVGVHSDTQVTLDERHHCVTQVLCSALPIAYTDLETSQWTQFAQLVLDATYEATFLVAIKNMERTGCNKLFLTLVGGGVFGNPIEWILAAIGRSVKRFAAAKLEVSIVSYGASKPAVASFVAKQTST